VIQLVSQCDAYPKAKNLLGSNPTEPKCISCVVKWIEDSFKVKTDRVKPLCDCELREKVTSRKIMDLKACQEIALISKDEFAKIAGQNAIGIAGSYHAESGRILLIEGEWCFANLIHEILHSRSVFSRQMPLSNLVFVSEGITELFVGIVLRKKLLNCYNKWKKADFCFLKPYEKYVKPWYYLTYKSSFDQIVDLYFNVNEKAPLAELGRLLYQSHDSEFKNLFGKYQTNRFALFSSFLDAMGSAFPNDFAEFQGTRLSNIKFEHTRYV
jgi:hypothetical protein